MTTIELPQINYSEFAALTRCEKQHRMLYIDGEADDHDPSIQSGLNLGTLLHLGGGRWQMGLGATLPVQWTDDINTGGKPGEVRTLRLDDFAPETVDLAEWLLNRYTLHYGSQPPSDWKLLSAEEWLTRKFGTGRSQWLLVGRSDGAVEIDGDIWLLERKSYRSKGRLDYVGVDPQLGCYSLLFEKKYGLRPHGVIYDGIYTYPYVPKVPTQKQLIEESGLIFGTKAAERDWAREAVARNPGIERPAEDSFERREVEISDAHLEAAKEYLASAVRRRRALIKRPGDALPNVGSHCSWCPVQEQCWDQLGAGYGDEIEFDDEA